MAVAGISTLGVTLGFGVETEAGKTPAVFNRLTRINSIGGINIEPEKIDASALEDAVTRSVAGRADNGGTWSVTVNYTDDTYKEWKKVIDAYNEGAKSGLRTWFEVVVPNVTGGFFVVAQPPQQLPMPEVSQNELMTMEISLTIEEYIGTATAIPLTEATGE